MSLSCSKAARCAPDQLLTALLLLLMVLLLLLLMVQVYDVCGRSEVYHGSLELSPGSKLSWMAFSTEGLLAAMDR